MSDRLDNISFDENTCPSLDQMLKYKDAALGEQESHVMERHLLGCSLCSEVIGHLQPDDIGEITALAAAIDLKVDKRISQGGTHGRDWNFNLFISIAAALTGVLLAAGNLFIIPPEYAADSTGRHADWEVPIELEGIPLAVEELQNQPQNAANGESESPEQTAASASVEKSISDDATVAESEIQVSTGENLLDADGQELAASSSDNVGQDVRQSEPDPLVEPATPRETFLTASVELFSVERIGTSTSTKGSTKKKVKQKSFSGYAPEYEDEQGFPIYKGGDEKLKEDIVKKINALHIVLGEGGHVEITMRIKANGSLGSIVLDENVSVVLANEIKRAIASLPAWDPGNVEIRYTMKVALQ
ncbi:MAG: hypothetical protein JKY52_13735 [Flavobacteriales bacterium]|nr:hypothetical protein [Flavobacteriales bacterium]